VKGHKGRFGHHASRLVPWLACAAAQAGGNVESLMEEVTRRNLFRKEIMKKVTDGESSGSARIDTRCTCCSCCARYTLHVFHT
jgi:hypothetical protein